MNDSNAVACFDDLDIWFEYPPDWELDVDEDGPRSTVSVQAPGGLAFALISVDASRPATAEMAGEALTAMREEYPDLDASPAHETIDGHRAAGHDLDFLSLDMVTSCAIRCYRTPRRTILIFTQWSDLADDNPEAALRAVRRSFAETDAP
jgi:hypothetical protein